MTYGEWDGVPLFGQLDDFVGQYADALSLPFSQLRTLMIFLLTYLLAVVHRYVPTTAGRHAYTAFTGFTLATYWLGFPIVHSVVTAAIVYLLVRFFNGKWMPAIAITFLMTYLTAAHIYRMIGTEIEWKVDFSLPQMILTVRLSSMAFQVHDGRGDPKKLRSYDRQRSSRCPSVLEYASFVFYFGSFFAGPYAELREYLEFTDRSLFKDLPGGRVPWPPLRQVVETVAIMLVAFYCAILAHTRFSEAVFLSDDFAILPFFQRILLMGMICAFYRAKYYTAWKFAEITSLLSGLSFNGVEVVEKEGTTKRRMKFDRCNNARLFKVEFMPNLHTGTSEWNSGVHRWLKRYVYLRMVPEGGKAGWKQTVAVSCVSAFWHGFYAGYYLFFGSLAVLTEVNRLSHRYIRQWALVVGQLCGAETPWMSFYDTLGIIATVLLIDYISIPFMIADFRLSLKVWGDLYYAGHIVMLVGLLSGITLALFPAPRKKEAKEQ